MESFNLSISQVNIEERDLTEGDSLNAFSDVYCYESDFKSDSKYLPVRGRKLKNTGGAEVKVGNERLIDLIHENSKEYYTQGSGRAGVPDFRLPNALSGGESASSESPRQDSPQQSQDQVSGNSPQQSHAQISGNTLRAFTDTVDALALQTSVLGKRDVLSPEQYARLSQQTQPDQATQALLSRLSNVKSLDASTNSGPVTGLLGASPTSSPVPYHAPHSDMAGHTRSSTPKSLHTDGVPSFETTPEEATTQNASGGQPERKLSAVERTRSTDSPQHRLNTSSPLLQAAFTSPEMIAKQSHHFESSIHDNTGETGSAKESSEKSFEGGVSGNSHFSSDIQNSQTMSLTQSDLANTSFTNSSSSGSVHEVVVSGDLIQVHQTNSGSVTSNLQETASENTLSVGASPSKDTTSKDVAIKDNSAAKSEDKVTKKSRKSSGSKKKGQKLIPIPKAEITTTVERPSGTWLRAACSNTRVPTADHGEQLPSAGEGAELVVDSEEGDERKEGVTGRDMDKVDGNETETEKSIESSQSPRSDSVNRETLRDNAVGASTQNRKSSATDTQEMLETAQVHGKDASKHVTLYAEETIIAKESSTGEMSHEVAVHVMRDTGESVEQRDVTEIEAPQVMETQAKFVKAKSTDSQTDSHSDMATFLHAGYDPQAAGDYSALKRQLDVLMKARAKLEGQLEVMEVESNAALQQRAQLQAELGTLQQQLKAQEASVTSATLERDALLSDMRTMKETRGRLEQVIVDAQKLLEDKDADLRTVAEDLRLARESHDKLQDALKHVKRELTAKTSIAEDLKNKIAELYVQFETANQTRILQGKEMEGVRAELRSVSTAKEWYQQQLQQAQQAKNQLQREMTSVKGEVIGKATMLERLKAENVRLQQMLADTQQRIIQEKRLLAGQLEAIEADMLEREAAFTHLERERDALQARLSGSPEHGHSQGDAVIKSERAELSADLQTSRLQNDVRRKQAHIAVLEHEQAELMKRLALSQESILERDKNLEHIEQKHLDTEVELRSAQQELGFTTEQLTTARHERSLLEMELRSVRHEKTSFDAVIHNLKGDMSKVESSFQRIKQELDKKTDELNKVKEEKERLNAEIVSKAKEAGGSGQTEADPATHIPQRQTESVQTAEPASSTPVIHDDTVSQLQAEKKELEAQLEQLGQQTQAQIQALHTEKLELESSLKHTAETTEPSHAIPLKEGTEPSQVDPIKEGSETSHVIPVKRGSEGEIVSKHTQIDITHQWEETIAEVYNAIQMVSAQSDSASNAELSGLVKEDLVKVYTKAESENVSGIIDENCRLKLALLKLQEQRQQLQAQQAEQLKQLKEQQQLQDEIQELKSAQQQVQNDQLQGADAPGELQTESQQPQDTQLRLQNEQLQSESQQLQKEQLQLQEQLHRLQQDLQLQQEVNVQLKQQLEADQQQKQDQVQSVEQQDYPTKEEFTLEQEIAELRTLCSTLETKLESTTESARAEKQILQAQLEELSNKVQEPKRKSIDGTDSDPLMTLTLELEKEKGKLAGVVQQYSQLKLHASVLESRLAAQQSQKVEQTVSAHQEAVSQQRSMDEIQASSKELQAALSKQSTAVKEIKKQLMTEKGNHVKTRRKYESLWVDHDQMRVDFEKKIRELEELMVVLEKTREREVTCRADHDKLAAQLQEARTSLAVLEHEVTQQREKDPVMTDTIQTLEWQLREKQQELEATRQQIQLAEERQALEYHNMRKTIQSNTSELSRLREEVTLTKRDRSTLQARVTDLKAALQSTVDSNKGASALKVDLAAIEALLKETHSPAKQSKPLSFIQATLSELRGEISTLQGHMDEHTSALHHSTLAWKELEQQVADLREVCKSTAAERESVQDLIPPAPTATLPHFTLPPTLQFSLPTDTSETTSSPAPNASHVVDASPAANAEKSHFSSAVNADDVIYTSPPENALETTIINGKVESVVDSNTSTPRQLSSPERRINTKAMELNSIYAPITKS